MAKPGPKPKYGENLVKYSMRMTPDQIRMLTASGTADFWRGVIENVAMYKLLLNDGIIDLDQYQKLISEAMVAMLPGEGGEDDKT